MPRTKIMEAYCGDEKCEKRYIWGHEHCCDCKKLKESMWAKIRCVSCAAKASAKQKLGRINSQIKKYIKEGKTQEEIIGLSELIKDNAKHFHGSNDDVKIIINHYFDKSIQLPIICVNGCVGKVNLN